MSSIPLVTLSKSCKLILLSDVHVGALEHAEREFDETLRWAKDEDALIFANGDIAENSIISGSAPGEKLLGQIKNPNDQVVEILYKLKPFARRGRLVGFTRGNHEARTRREAMFDLCEFMAHYLDVPYLRVGGYVRFVAGGEVYNTAIQHGRAHGANPWLELDRMQKLYPVAELVALGHNHVLGARPVEAFGISPQGTECLREVWQVRTGSYLKYAEYVRELVALPQKIGSPIVTFDRKKHRIHVDASTLSWDIE